MGEMNKRARAAIRWDKVVGRVWKEIAGNREDILSVEEFGGYKTETKGQEIREILSFDSVKEKVEGMIF